MLGYSFPWPRVPACSAKFSSYLEPLLHLVDQITFCIFPHTTEKDSQPTIALISKQSFPYWTRGGTCYPRVSTPNTQSLADLSMTNYISWQVPTISTIPYLAHTTTSNLTMVNSHLSMDGRAQHSHKYTSHTQHHKDGCGINPNPKGIRLR
jgi:hypothetical protein